LILIFGCSYKGGFGLILPRDDDEEEEEESCRDGYPEERQGIFTVILASFMEKKTNVKMTPFK